jgi:RND family efflux transporter MFP subunit
VFLPTVKPIIAMAIRVVAKKYKPYKFIVAATLLVSMSNSAAQNATPVRIATADLVPIVEEVFLTGTVTSPRVARLSTSVGGLVQQVYVDAGDPVERGALLLNLDPELEEIALGRTQAGIREARAELADAKRRLSDAQRVKSLGITEQEVRSLQAEVSIDEAALEQLQAEQRRHAALLERHNLVAPFSGVVSDKLTEAGEWVQTGTPVFELIATDQLRMVFQVSQEYYPRIDEDNALQVELDAVPNQRFAGRISAVVPVSDRNARTFTLRVVLEDVTVPMIPGMSVRAMLRLGTGGRGVVVSRDALVRYPDGRITVWLVDDSDATPTVSERPVSTGIAFSGQVQITEGLEPGAKIVVQGNEVLENGQTIQIQGGG